MAGVVPRRCCERYFTLEDPRRLEPAERELYVETLLDSKLLLRGFVDRLDVAPDGAIRVVDYKTGRSPGEMFEAKALFQMKFYALVIWRTRGVVPAMLQLVYLGNGEILRYVPDEADLLATERKVEALWQAIRLAEETGDWRPSPGRLCDWCAHQASARRAAALPRRCRSEPGSSTSRSRPAGLSARDPRLVTNRRARRRDLRLVTKRRRPSRGTTQPSAVVRRPDLGQVDADEGVGEHPALAGEHRHVVLHHQHQAAGRLGRLGAGVGVLDRQASAGATPSAAAAVRYGSGCGLP